MKKPYELEAVIIEEEKDEEKKPFLKLGYFLGRYTDLEVEFKEKDGKVYARAGQNLDLSTLFEDLKEIWRSK